MEQLRTTYDETTRTWRGPTVKTLFNPEASLGQVMLNVLDRSPEREMQRDMDTGRSLTYAEFRMRLVRFAQNLTKLGVRSGDVVALINTNSENVAPLACALLTIGAPFNPIAPGFHEDDMAHMLAISRPKLVFCDADNYIVVRKALKRVYTQAADLPPVYVFECTRDDVQHAEDLLAETGTENQFMAPYLGDSHKKVAVILCSSGTTGSHKGVQLTHALCALLSPLYVFMPKPSIEFAFSALYWMSGFHSMLNVFTTGGVRLITRKPFNEETFFEVIEKHRASLVFTPPAYASAILAHPRSKTVDFSSLITWAVGGSPVPDGLRDRIDALLAPSGGRSFNGYGSSETGSVAADVLGRKPNAIGSIMPNVEVRIVDEKGQRLGVGEQGELLVRSCEGFAGYYGNGQASAAAIDPEGFFRSGDVGFLDEDGFLHLVDRQKDIFKFRNFHVSPTDLEEIVLRIAGVQDACVFGIPHVDGDLPAVAIVRLPGATGPDAEQVRSTVDEQVADFKRLRGGVFFMSEFPKTQSGKVLRRKVAEEIRQLRDRQPELTGKL
ncbi:probable 4-coumarate--CoA ligase 1 [Anopheles nili]|uniref:probable 4-coumarate--CoA ligase 1 n=1 Tax=Anopheles nili TaxID=185578 RepID=UPI00237A685C|nr:probable 4-coumarate--CoA ligase 1 [Anopheles nili]